MNRHAIRLLCGLSIWAMATPHALAQDAQDSASDPQAEDTALAPEQRTFNEIIVTAQKRAENIQDVPISIAAIGSETIVDLNASTIQGLEGAVPNVEIGNFSNTPNTAVFTIRGIGVIEPDPYAGNTVGIVVDGQPQFFSTGALLDLYDIERIEILRGPQGTLFGANTTGGVVNIVNNRPTNEWGGRLDLGYGNYDQIQVGGVINAPLGETLSARFAVNHTERDGYVYNVIDGSDMGHRNVTLYRGMLRFQNGNFDATLMGEYDRSRNGAPIVIAGNVPSDVEYVPEGFLDMYRSPCLPQGSRCVAPDTYFSAQDGGILNDTRDQSDMNNYRAGLDMKLTDTALGDLTSITAYREFDLFEFTDQDGSPVFLIDTRRGTEGWQFSQEMRTDFDLGGIDFTVGGFYMKTHYDHYQDLRIDFAGGVNYDLESGEITKGLPGLFQKNIQDQDNHSLSFFAQSYFDLTERLRAQAGIRYTYEKTKMLASTATSLSTTGVTTFDGTAPDGTPNIALGTAAPPLGIKSWNNVGWKLGLDYEVADDVMLYTYWARGFKSGGFTGRIGIPQDLGPYDPEEVDTFEIGVKGDFLNGIARVNLAAFYTDYRAMQLAQIYFVGSGQDLVQGNTILNAASSSIKGFEAELSLLATEGLILNGALAYLDAQYENFDYLLPSGEVVDLSGERLQNAPKWSANAGFTYAFDLTPDVEARLGANYAYSSEKLLTSIIDTPRARVQPTHLVNANASVKFKDAYTLGVWATNLLDERYIASVFDAPGTLGLTNYAPPRMYGVKFSAEW